MAESQPLPTPPLPRAELGRRLRWGIVASAVVLSLLVLGINTFRPRTDDATVTANVVGIAPRVSGPIVRFAVADNQFVRKGDLLFEVDPVPYRDALERAEAEAGNTQDTLGRLEPLLPKAYATVQQVNQARASQRAAAAARDTARYDLESCRVTAPFDGYVSNLNLSAGAFAHAEAEVLTLIDTGNWYVIADFRESVLKHIAPGQRAEVRLMTRPGLVYRGVVQGIGRGVVPQESPQMSGLPKVQRELNWVRLAQRFPVRIRLDAAPEDGNLRVGASAVVTLGSHAAAPQP